MCTVSFSSYVSAEERNAIKLIRDVLHKIEYHDDRVERRGPGRYDIADLGELTIGILRNVPRA